MSVAGCQLIYSWGLLDVATGCRMWLKLLNAIARHGSIFCCRMLDVGQYSAGGCLVWLNLLPTVAACGSTFYQWLPDMAQP